MKNEYLITFLKFVSQKYQKHSKLLSLLFFTWKGKTSFIEKSIKICFIPVVFWVIICNTNFYDQCGNRTRWPMSCSVSFSLDLDPSIWEKMLVGKLLSDCYSHLKGWKTLINWNNVSITKVNISALDRISSLFCLRIESTPSFVWCLQFLPDYGFLTENTVTPRYPTQLVPFKNWYRSRTN